MPETVTTEMLLAELRVLARKFDRLQEQLSLLVLDVREMRDEMRIQMTRLMQVQRDPAVADLERRLDRIERHLDTIGR